MADGVAIPFVASKAKAGQSSLEISSHERDYGTFFKAQTHFLDLSYEELEAMNLEVKAERLRGVSSEEMQGRFLTYLEGEKGIKAVTVCFTDIEGKLHLLDYDKKFLLGSYDNLTFDGSSIRGFTAQSESDLRLSIDWSSFRWVPADIFGAGKVLVFANVCDKDGSFYDSDFRSGLSLLSKELREKEGITVNLATEIEGFLLNGVNAEQDFDESTGFNLATMSGYYNCLPQDILRLFIDKLAEVERALGFENEKDHPEVAPAQFEINYKYSVVLDAADQIQLYKFVARQIAKTMGLTASFLPKPLAGMNGSGMHTNMSLSKDGTNIFFDANGKNMLSNDAWKFLTGILHRANDLCLLMNSSVNSYRRLDPRYEAPNEIKVSAVDRGSMIRIPLGNAKSARIEVRTVAPDANPYLYNYALIKAGMAALKMEESEYGNMEKAVYGAEVVKLPGEIFTALDHFEKSTFLASIMGEDNHRKYADVKRMAADRSPKALGSRVKTGEVIYHHEVTNQMIWAGF